jgi:putative addiction module component (TIGR02574 family)
MPDNSLTIEIKQLTIAERILLVEEIWDSIIADGTNLLPTKAQQDELDRRLSTAEQEDSGNTWDAIKSRLLEKK